MLVGRLMVILFYYFYLSLFCLFPPLVLLRSTFGSPHLFFFLSVPYRAPPCNVGFINVNIVKYLRRYFNIEIGTLFV